MKGSTNLVFACGLLSLALTGAAVQLHVLDDGVDGVVIEFLRRWMPTATETATRVGPTSPFSISDASVISAMQILTAFLGVTGFATAIAQRAHQELSKRGAVGATLCGAALLWQLAHFRPWRYLNLV